MTKHNSYISGNQTYFFKEIAILCILLHNFFHLVEPVTYQNEMFFAQRLVYQFMREFSLSEAFNAFFLFLVFTEYIFLFFSADMV